VNPTHHAAVGCALVVALTGSFLFALYHSTALAKGTVPAPVYFCPDKPPDQQLSGRQAPGCIPLIDEQEETLKAEKREAARKKGQEVKAPPSMRRDDLERETSSFLHDYRRFLQCCLNDPDAIDTVESLDDRASGLLKDIQEKALVNMQTNQRGMTLSQFIPPLARAKLDLGTLRKKLESLEKTKDKLGDLDYETAGRERKRIQSEEEALLRNFRPTLPPEAARTGTEIGDTTTPNKYGEAVGSTTLQPATGTDIGTVVSPGSDQEQSLRMRMGLDTQDSTLKPRIGAESQDTTLQPSIGFETGTPQGPTGESTTPSRAGPAIGDSSLNKR
jgi:hypothetical protein